MILSFKPYSDAGRPEMVEADGIMSTSYQAGERGRWITENIPAAPGDVHVVQTAARVTEKASAQVVIVFWKAGQNWQLHSTLSADPLVSALEDFTAFEMPFSVPEGVDKFRVELRSWTGSGVSEFMPVYLNEEPEQPDIPDLPQRELTGFVRGRMLTVQDVTASSAELVDWECLPVVGMAWGDDIFLTIVRNEEQED